MIMPTTQTQSNQPSSCTLKHLHLDSPILNGFEERQYQIYSFSSNHTTHLPTAAMFNVLKLASLALLAAPTVLASDIIVQNNCKFNVWCSAAKNDGASSALVKVKAGRHYKSPLPAYNDNVGSVLKCTDVSGSRKVFQVELAVQNGRSWFDLSAIDGDPFLSHHRHAELAGQCVIDCPAGSTSCYYPLQVDCASTENAVLTIC